MTDKQLAHHIRWRHGTKECDLCKKSIRAKNFHAHMKLVHLGQEQNVCEQCGMVCKTRAIYKTHVLAKHTETDPVQCEICNAWFKNKINHRHHYLTTHADTQYNKPMTCPTCGVIRKNKKSLMSHMKVHDVEYKKHFTCSICGFRCANNTQLRNHSEIHKSIRDKVKCDQCLKEFTSIGGLRVSGIRILRGKNGSELMSHFLFAEACSHSHSSRTIPLSLLHPDIHI